LDFCLHGAGLWVDPQHGPIVVADHPEVVDGVDQSLWSVGRKHHRWVQGGQGFVRGSRSVDPGALDDEAGVAESKASALDEGAEALATAATKSAAIAAAWVRDLILA
jgi:hypothetical protein